MSNYPLQNPPIPLLDGVRKVHWKDLCVESERLYLRPVEISDGDIIFENFTDEITRYMRPATPTSVNDCLSFIESSQVAMAAGTEFVFAICDRSSDEFLGCAGLHSSVSNTILELGIWIRGSAHGGRYGREAVHALYNWGKERFEVEYFTYPVDRANIPSRKVAESLAGVIIEEKRTPTQNGGELDTLVYRID